ncbi:hypothetical protein [Micromonospora sp. NBC_00421]|uniref:hypothetical protein n=1 Tax=Micromonospora sp. NBC_00421 TaxID=2975976 RepID=UPI002E219BC7
MARYQLDDPALAAALAEIAERDTANWPEPDAEQMATLARLLNANTRSRRPASAAQPLRRAA